MATRNLVTDFGAVANGQRVTGIGAAISGSTLTVDANIFASGDVGKTIGIYQPVDPYFFHLANITGYTSPTVVTLSVSSTLANTAGMEIKWGTDNKNVFLTGWRTWAQTQTNPADPPVLQIPNGHFCISVGGTDHLNLDVKNPKWVGLSGNADLCILSQLYVPGEIRFGTAAHATSLIPLDNTGANSARLQTATAGQTQVTLVNAGVYGSRIFTDRWCLIGGFDTQSNGYPPNNQFYEWNYITGYSGGVVSLLNPLQLDYKSTWPLWVGPTAGNCDYGGPATIWVTPAGFDTSVELDDFTILAINGSSVIARDVILRRMKMVGYGIYPTQIKSFYAQNCVWPQDMEVDKMVDEVTLEGCTTRRNWQQSSSPNRMIINGGSLDTLNASRYTEVNNVTFTGIGKVEIGTFYGNCTRLVMNNCTGIKELNPGGPNLTNLTNFSWVGGNLRYLKAGGNSIGWMSPGAWVGFNNNKYFDRIVDVWEDGTYVYMSFARTTNWPFSTPTQIGRHLMPDLTVRGCTGTLGILPDWNAAPARAPVYSYSIRTYVGNPTSLGEYNTAYDKWPELWGHPVSIKATVSTIFAGGTALAFKLTGGDNWGYVRESDMTTQNNFGAAIDMKTLGTRTMANAAAPVGSVGADSLFNFATTGSVWFFDNSNSAPGFTANVTNGNTPTVTIEWIMDQGVASEVIAPTRMPIAGPVGLRIRGG